MYDATVRSMIRKNVELPLAQRPPTWWRST